MIGLCPHFNSCAGCSEPLGQTLPDLWSEICLSLMPEHPPKIHQGVSIGWRTRAKVAVRGTVQNPQIGLFKKHSHDVHPIPGCLVHHPKLNEAFELFRQFMVTNSLTPYQELTGTGSVRYLQGVVQRESGKVQLSLVLNTRDPRDPESLRMKRLLKQFGEDFADFWHSLWINFNDCSTNSIFGKEWHLNWGQELLWEKLGGIEVCFGPSSFGQANLSLFEKMLFRIKELVPENTNSAEFYAGVGAIGLFLASHCRSLHCIEINPLAKILFEHSRNRLPLQAANRLSFTTAPSDQALDVLPEASVVIADPPRKGLDKKLLDALCEKSHLEQLLYISCGWESFKRDYTRLLEHGWKLETLDGYHFFPGSSHMELLANFRRE